MTDAQKHELLLERQIYRKEIARTWQKTLGKYLRYKAPNAVNYELAVEAVNNGEKVWVLPLMMRPGKQSLFFSLLNQQSKIHEIAV